MLYQFPFFALAPTEVPGREVSIVAISETVLVLAGGTAILSILFGVRVAMRAVAGGAAAPRSDGGQAAGGSGTPDVAGVIALPPLIVFGFLAAAAVLEAIVPLPVPVAHSLAHYVAGATLAAGGFVIIAIGTRRFAAAGTNVPPTLPTTALVVDGIYGRTRRTGRIIRWATGYGPRICTARAASLKGMADIMRPAAPAPFISELRFETN